VAASPPPPSGPLSYGASGVDYGRIDPLKIAAQRAALATGARLDGHGFSEVSASRGESAFVVDVGPFYLASIVECLGSKALVADAMAELTGASAYADIAQDTIAMAVNDLMTVGATPLVVQAYWAAGGSDWFDDAQRSAALVAGWQRACELCGVAWGGGETPALAGIVERGRVDLAASCTGIVSPKPRLTLGEHLAPGDAIVLLASSGIHANGVSLARQVAERLPRGYLTPVSDSPVPIGFGEALLVPTMLYAPVTEALFRAGIRVRYAVNVTGHGWRKLMRLDEPFVYHMTDVGAVPPIFEFIMDRGPVDRREAYATFNMGAGFAVFVPPTDAQRTVRLAQSLRHTAWQGGTVQKQGNRKAVEIVPLGITYEGDTLPVR